MSFWRTFYHLTWATVGRLPLVDKSREELIHATIHAKAKEREVFLHAIGGIADHIHVVASIPPKLAVANVVGEFKGVSSHAVGVRFPCEFKWQDSYGAVTFGERSLARVVRYVRNQKQHHDEGRLVSLFELSSSQEN